jgi:cellulose synthase/poly-beta-1,6-N-acetylglucosamine synthase-like glycosyltransferase
MESMEQLNYPDNLLEIILVDDDSTDATQAVMQHYASRHDNWRVLQHHKDTDALKGKKGALTQAIQMSRSEIILMTDADCTVPPNWIISTMAYFRPEVGMILGNSPVIKKPGFLNIYQRFDNLCEAALAAATTAYNKPSHSNARNLAFRKAVFQEVGGYQKIAQLATGDDFFLTQRIRSTTDWCFAYNLNPDSFIPTEEPDWGKRYIHQQLRRNSKAFYLTPPFLVMGGWIALFHLSLLALLLVPSHWGLLGILLALKFGFELIPVWIATRLFNKKDLLKYYPVLWVIYPIFYLSSQLLGALQKHRWK